MNRRQAIALSASALACPTSLLAHHSLGDSDPVAFRGPDPQRAPVQGIDLSRFQPEVDWRQVRRSGVRFAFVKATEGGDLRDPLFSTHWSGAGAGRVARGAYHFYYFCTAPEVQARWFIRNVPKRRGDLPPVLDAEWNPLSPTCRRRPSGRDVRGVLSIWLRLVSEHFGQRPVIYTTPGFYRDTELWRLRGYEFWLRSTARSLAEAYPGQGWAFWQFTATGIVPGIRGNVDRNIFNGSRADWSRWRKRRSI